MVVLAHGIGLTDDVDHLHILKRQCHLQRIGRFGFVDRPGQHVQHRHERQFREIRIVALAPVDGQFLGFGALMVDGDIAVKIDDRR